MKSADQQEERLLLLLTLLISALTGLVIVGFVALTERMGERLVHAGPWERFWSPVVGSLVAGLLLHYLFADARGSGIPQTRVALLLNRGYISIKTVIGKFVCSSLSLSSGVALGREGPSVHIGAGIASVVGRRLGLSESGVRSLIPVGTAAAVAAAFNTPLAAVLFTLEEILADLHARLIGSVVLGAATSWMVLRLMLGDEPIFHVPAYRLVHPVEFVFYALLGVGGGLMSVVFVQALLRLRVLFQQLPRAAKPFAPPAGGLVVGLLAIWFPGVLGVGYHLVSDALNGKMALTAMLLLLVLKLIATSASYSSGNAGGVFGPSLFLGAMLGGAVGRAAHQLLPDLTANAGAYALVGMGAAFAGIIRTPMTSVIMIFEITRDYSIIVPLMLANLVSFLISRRLQPVPLYEALLAQEGVRMPSPEHRPEPLLVSAAMRPLDKPESASALEGVYPDDSLDTALQLMASQKADKLVVLARAGGHVVGFVHKADVLLAYEKPEEKDAGERVAQRDWLPAAIVAGMAVLVLAVSLVLWQRGTKMERARQAYSAGEAHLAEGRADEAVLDFRMALANDPQANAARAMLGFALLERGQLNEAAEYLEQAARQNPNSGPILAGLGHIANARGNTDQARQLMQRSIHANWPSGQTAQRNEAEIAYAAMLYREGHRAEATLLLVNVIEQSGGNLQAGARAAAMIASNDTPARAEEAYTLLAERFPADGQVWAKLGEARLANGKKAEALAAWIEAARHQPEDAAVRRKARMLAAVVQLDPARPSLTLAQRARLWRGLEAAVRDVARGCGVSTTTRARSTDLMQSTLEQWDELPQECRKDETLTAVLEAFRSKK